jgi:hypothetical protein
MLDVLMCFEVQLADVQLNYDATDRPDVTNVLPLAAAHNYFGRAILPGINGFAVVLMLFSRTTKVNNSNSVILRK